MRSTLYTALASGTASSSTISRLLSEAIVDVDHAITREFQRLFPGGRESFARLSDQQIASAMKSKGGAVSRSALRCMQGSTALITLVDPSGTNLWVANLGDCRAGKCFATTFLRIASGREQTSTCSHQFISACLEKSCRLLFCAKSE